MAWNFRRRVKILPGVTLNFSKKGVSTTVGVKGANINFGKRGTYLNTGIPGTGLYKREKIGGSMPNSHITQNEPNGCSLFFYVFIAIFFIAIAFAIHIAFGIILLIVSTFILVNFLSKKESKSNIAYPESSIPSSIRSKYNLPDTQFLSQTFFRDLTKQINDYIAFARRLDRDKKFHDHTDELKCVNIQLTGGKFGDLDPDSFLGKILILMLVDLTRSLLNAGHKLDLNTKEGFGLVILMSTMYGNKISYDTIELYRKNLVEPSEDFA